MGTKETTLISHTTKDRTQNPDYNIQMYHQHGTKVLTGPNQHNNSTQDNMPSKNTGTMLHTPKVKYQTFAAWSFMYSAPTLLDQLPKFIKDSPTLDIFKKRLDIYSGRPSTQINIATQTKPITCVLCTVHEKTTLKYSSS